MKRSSCVNAMKQQNNWQLAFEVCMYGPHHTKTCLQACAKCANSHNLEYAQGLIQAFALY